MKLLVIELLGLMNGLAGQVHAQLLEDVVVYLSQNDRGVYLTAARLLFVKLLVIELLGLMNGLAGQVHAQLLEDVVVYLSQNDRGVYLTAA